MRPTTGIYRPQSPSSAGTARPTRATGVFRSSRPLRKSRITPPRKVLLAFDVMLRDKWICTLRMPVTPGEEIPYEYFSFFVEMKRPSLRGKPYHIEFITSKPQFRE